MKDPEYMKISIDLFSENIIKKYNLMNIVHENYVYIKIKQDMYGLKQAAVLAHKQLVTNLRKEGYRPIPGTSGLWKYHTQKTKMVLCIDDFGVNII